MAKHSYEDIYTSLWWVWCDDSRRDYTPSQLRSLSIDSLRARHGQASWFSQQQKKIQILNSSIIWLFAQLTWAYYIAIHNVQCACVCCFSICLKLSNTEKGSQEPYLFFTKFWRILYGAKHPKATRESYGTVRTIFWICYKISFHHVMG